MFTKKGRELLKQKKEEGRKRIICKCTNWEKIARKIKKDRQKSIKTYREIKTKIEEKG